MAERPAAAGAVKRLPLRWLLSIAVWGPGLLVMLADTDPGNIVTAAQSGSKWGYHLLPLLVALIPLLYMVQELTVRLGIFTGRGHGELIREKFGPGWAWFAVLGLTVAAVGSMVTEFTGVAGVGEMYGLSRSVTVPGAAVVLMAIVLSGSYQRMERATLLIGLFELAFFVVAGVSHPDFAKIARSVTDLPLGNHEFLFLAAALIGASFNPWMIFYQQSAVADKRLTPEQYPAARWDTAIGAVLTQLLTGAVLIAAATTLGGKHPVPLDSVGDVSRALTPILGRKAGRLIFSIGVLGAAMVAAIVASQAFSWGIGEAAGYRRSLESRAKPALWFHGVYVACVAGSALLVWASPDLVWLTVAAQVVNTFMLPMLIGFLVVLARRSLPDAQRLRGGYLALLLLAGGATCIIGFVGGLSGFWG